MIRVDSVTTYLAPRCRLARMNAKSLWKDIKDIKPEDFDFVRETKEFMNEALQDNQIGQVYTDGIKENFEAKKLLHTSKSGLQRYAKLNNINIIFYTPFADEFVSSGLKKPMEISVLSKEGFLGTTYIDRQIIEGDTSRITQHTTKNIFVKNKNSYSVESTKDETFLRRVYRTITEIKNNIDNERKREINSW